MKLSTAVFGGLVVCAFGAFIAGAIRGDNSVLEREPTPNATAARALNPGTNSDSFVTALYIYDTLFAGNSDAELKRLGQETCEDIRSGFYTEEQLSDRAAQRFSTVNFRATGNRHGRTVVAAARKYLGC
ncbi:hypothetical protein [Catellatospora sichuanensis]|uniref:hypothetical protein n=1 Tax=Catellatospora sichuanensis TaxID=1969805 RepID=UPI001183D24E|nr:hypothetical protein [Catellatospora sichuanensis]